MASNLAIALMHYPVYNKHHELVVTALTNLDLHDIARSACTYGLDRFYIVTPSLSQQELAGRIINHWQAGSGATYNPDRQEATSIIRVCTTLEEACYDYRQSFRLPVTTIATGATCRDGSLSFTDFRQMLNDNHNQPHLLMLGTGWGLADECFSSADHTLMPIAGFGEYNHLSVRAAAAIMLDRLRGFP